MVLFWHGLFATSDTKVFQEKSMLSQLEMFRRLGLGDFKKLLIELSKDPAMIFWLDNQDNHNGAINENYGRELLELFSMGVGNYTEDDIRECSRAFTGWTIENVDYMVLRTHNASIWPYSKIAWQFRYDDKDHDEGLKTFLGETGNFNGEDIVDIIVRQKATAQFLSHRMYQFFVSHTVDKDGEQLISEMEHVYFESGREVRAMLRTMFNSEHFKSDPVKYAQVKSPAELVAGTLRLARAMQWPTLEIRDATLASSYMGQQLFGPPSVEGWHEGDEWIDSGALVERVNFASEYMGDVSQPGVQDVLDSLTKINHGEPSNAEVVDLCFDMMGIVGVGEGARDVLVTHLNEEGELNLRDDATKESSKRRIVEALRLIVSTREYQLA
jgi:uncharacterized protein (DUF1800 family)